MARTPPPYRAAAPKRNRPHETRPDGVPNTYIGGMRFSRSKQQFLALYKHVGIFRLTKQFAVDLVLWPEGLTIPEDYVLRSWIWEFEEGSYLPHENIEKNMEKKLQVYPKWRQFQMIEKNMQTNEFLNQQIQDGTFNEKLLPALQHTSNAANYGVQTGARAAAQNDNGNKQTINFNNFAMLTSGKKQPRIAGKQPKQKIINAEVKVLPVGNPDS